MVVAVLTVVVITTVPGSAPAHPQEARTTTWTSSGTVTGMLWLRRDGRTAGAIAFLVHQAGAVRDDDPRAGAWYEAVVNGARRVYSGEPTTIELDAIEGGEMRLPLGRWGVARLTVTPIGSVEPARSWGITTTWEGRGDEHHSWAVWSDMAGVTRAKITGRLGPYTITTRSPFGARFETPAFLARSSTSQTQRDLD